MTLTKRRPWEGYRYFRSETLIGDHTRLPGEGLAVALERTGARLGEWIGAATGLLGVSGPVTEKQLAALFGEGLHPRAEQIVAERTAAGCKAGQALRAAKLGRAFPHYTGSRFQRQLDGVLVSAERGLGRPLKRAEKAHLREREASRAFAQDYRRYPEDKHELEGYIARRMRPDAEPVAAFDLVLHLPKSASVWFALGGDEVRARILGARRQAVADTVEFIENNALAFRTGPGGAAQHDASSGLVAAWFQHDDSRLGDPLLHDHLLIANQVFDPAADRWRRIDGRLLFGQAVAISEFHNQRVIELLCQALNVRATAREATPARAPVIELEGVNCALIRLFSQRRTQITPALEQLLDGYLQRHGHPPRTPAARQALMRQATLATRPPKKTPTSPEQQQAHWRARARQATGTERIAPPPAQPPPAAPPVDLDEAAHRIVATVSGQRAVFARRHLEAEARRHLVLLTRGHPPAPGLAEQTTERAVALCRAITTPDPHRSFAPLLRADGTSVYRRRGRELYTTEETLALERALLFAARTPAIPAAGYDLFDRHAARHTRLNPGQRSLAAAFACGERVLQVGIGPAGSGKTSALRLFADTVRAAGGNVIALAPSSRAAQVMSADLGQDAYTAHRWLAAQEAAAKGRQVQPGFRLKAGDVIVVDEAGMASTRHLAQITAHAQRAGALVRLVGDPAQLGSVEAGGALRMLANEPTTVHLTQLHRFTAEGEDTASLQLRDGDPAAADWYHQGGRLHGGEQDLMADTVFTAWSSDVAAGLQSVMLAPDNASVTALNQRAQAWRAATGHLGAQGPRLRDGSRAHLGDTLVTRSNERTWTTLGGRDFVKNGDTWTVEHFTDDGAALVRHTHHRGRVRLPAEYLATHTELGYATTVHRAQGITVDTAHALLGATTSRESAYVAATRGQLANHLYLPGDRTPLEALRAITARSSAPVSAHDAIAHARDHIVRLAALAAEYAAVTSEADTLRLAVQARARLGRSAELLLGADAWPTLQRTLRRAENAGWSAGSVLDRTRLFDRTTGQFGHGTGFETAFEPAALMSWRIDLHLRGHTRATTAADEPRPLVQLTGPQLALLAGACDRLRKRTLGDLFTPATFILTTPDPARLARLAAAREAADLADHLGVRIRTEQRLRTVLPDQPPPAPDHIGALPDWLADPTAWRDPTTPDHWRAHLTERRAVLAGQLRDTGRRLATAPPAWLRPLGAPPPVESATLRRAWEHAAALVAAWRAVHRTPRAYELLGARPADPDERAAFDALAAHLQRTSSRTRAHHIRLARAADPVALREDAAAHLAATGRLRPIPSPPTGPGPAPVRPPAPAVRRTRAEQTTWWLLEAEVQAAQALFAVTNDQTPPEEWMAYIPAPDPDDTGQQTLFADLLTAIGQWRQRHHVTGEEPLGDAPPDESERTEWQHLAEALELYQTSRVQDRLAKIRARRLEDRARLDRVTKDSVDRTNRPRTPGGRRPSGDTRPR